MSTINLKHNNIYIGRWFILTGVQFKPFIENCTDCRTYFVFKMYGAFFKKTSLGLPFASIRVRAQVKLRGICGGYSSTGAGFLRVLRYPLQILIILTAPHSSSIIRGWHNRPVSDGRNGRAAAQAGSRWLPTAAARVRVQAGMWSMWWTKRHWGRFSEYFCFPCQSLFHQFFSIIIIIRGWHNRPIGGRSAEWAQLDFTPHYTN
jgi:hypothetical protein